MVPVIATRRLTNDRVKVSSFLLQCQKTSETTRPIVSIQYSVLAEAAGNTKAEERATLDYSTKIAVDHIDTVALQVLTDGGSEQLTPIPNDTPRPLITVRPTSTHTPTPVIEVPGGAVTIGHGSRIHTITTRGTVAAQSNVTGDAGVLAGGVGLYSLGPFLVLSTLLMLGVNQLAVALLRRERAAAALDTATGSP